MLTGSLPFDELSIPKLYQKIRGTIVILVILENKYTCPPYLTGAAKDLIFRMLQADPLNRISIPEIKMHKWYH